MSWYQPDDITIRLRDNHGHGHIGDLYIREKIKLFCWNRLIPGCLRVRLIGSALHRWVIS